MVNILPDFVVSYLLAIFSPIAKLSQGFLFENSAFSCLSAPVQRPCCYGLILWWLLIQRVDMQSWQGRNELVGLKAHRDHT